MLKIFSIAIAMMVSFTLVGCGSTQTKEQSSKPNVASEREVELSSLVLSKASPGARYGVLLGVYINAAQANAMIDKSMAELVGVGVKNPTVKSLKVIDAKGKKAIAVIAGQYPDLANAHYLQRIVTRLIPGQYNLITVPNNIWQ